METRRNVGLQYVLWHAVQLGLQSKQLYAPVAHYLQENSKDPTRNRAQDLPSCGAVPQPTALQPPTNQGIPTSSQYLTMLALQNAWDFFYFVHWACDLTEKMEYRMSMWSGETEETHKPQNLLRPRSSEMWYRWPTYLPTPRRPLLVTTSNSRCSAPVGRCNNSA